MHSGSLEGEPPTHTTFPPLPHPCTKGDKVSTKLPNFFNAVVFTAGYTEAREKNKAK